MEDRAVKPGPYIGNRLMEDAWQKGRSARAAGTPKKACPFGEYPGRAFRRAWEEGWEAAGPPGVVAQVPNIVTQEPPVQHGTFLAPEVPLPTFYFRPSPTGCKKCRCILLPDGSKAVIVRSGLEQIVYLECRACGNRFQLPIHEGPFPPTVTAQPPARAEPPAV